MFSLPAFIFLGLIAWVLAGAAQDLAAGGNSWKQGDWLINSDEITIRRGLVGSAILALARLTALNPVLLTVLIQSALVVLTAALTSVAIARSRHHVLLWLLVLCPGFFVSFWALDIQGGLRKELIVFLAFAVLLFGASRPDFAKIWAYLSAIIFALGVLGHEGNVLFAPFFGLCYYQIARQDRLTRADLAALAGIIGIACLTAIMAAILFRNVDDHMAVCRPVLAMGVDPAFCAGAIQALEIPLSDFMRTTFWMFFSPKVLSFALLYGLTIGFVIVIGGMLFDRKAFIITYAVSALAFAPLYAVAVDWGRWVSFHTTAVIFTMLILLAVGHAAQKAPRVPAIPVYLGLLIYPLVWGFSHFVDVIWGGIAWKTAQQIMGI